MTRPPAPERRDDPGCACGATLWRHVLDDRVWPDGTDVLACLACGAVRAEHVYWDAGTDARESTVAGFADRPLPGDVLAWLGEWPRLASGRGAFYLPAAARAGSAAELVALEEPAVAAQEATSPLRRVAAAGFPAAPPPESLPGDLGVFRFAWWAMTAPDAEVALRLRARTWPGEKRGHPAFLAYEKARRQEWAESLAARLAGEGRDEALREIADAGRWETTFDSRHVVVTGPPPSLRPLVESLPRSPGVEAALASFARWGD